MDLLLNKTGNQLSEFNCPLRFIYSPLNLRITIIGHGNVDGFINRLKLTIGFFWRVGVNSMGTWSWGHVITTFLFRHIDIHFVLSAAHLHKGKKNDIFLADFIFVSPLLLIRNNRIGHRLFQIN